MIHSKAHYKQDALAAMSIMDLEIITTNLVS